MVYINATDINKSIDTCNKTKYIKNCKFINWYGKNSINLKAISADQCLRKNKNNNGVGLGKCDPNDINEQLYVSSSQALSYTYSEPQPINEHIDRDGY